MQLVALQQGVWWLYTSTVHFAEAHDSFERRAAWAWLCSNIRHFHQCCKPEACRWACPGTWCHAPILRQDVSCCSPQLQTPSLIVLSQQVLSALLGVLLLASAAAERAGPQRPPARTSSDAERLVQVR